MFTLNINIVGDGLCEDQGCLDEERGRCKEEHEGIKQ